VIVEFPKHELDVFGPNSKRRWILSILKPLLSRLDELITRVSKNTRYNLECILSNVP
jgi:hypothetical protein